VTRHSAEVERSPFGRTEDGELVERFTLTGAGGVEVRVITYGAIIQSLRVPDRYGQLADVVLGYDDMQGYEGDAQFHGAIVGRFANRIARGTFTLDGTEYRLDVNDGPNHLHGGSGGFYTVLWEAEPFSDGTDVGVVLRYRSPDGEQGYPGNLDVRVTYTLGADNTLAVDYHATTDRPTPVNLTQHSYFNLGGHDAGSILDHRLRIDADRYTPVDDTSIPTGSHAPVQGTPFDFRQPTPIGERIDADDEQLRITGGYDHNFVLNAGGGEVTLAARVHDPGSGRVLEVLTTEPGVQFYAGNYLDGKRPGKGGERYHRRTGFCLETQHFPDAPNQPEFPSAILRPGETLRSRTEFRFSVEG
jgi:aldose 1-epimerase